ncbi:Beta-glucan synthesis-associated protein SKN1 [Tetrabaena socialis]|uniref:Beta-glucan synthesis-associated protein SKN1 n=1 Tax=Tetrabaena socialis TaxID=47790 RepID=A0A2J7ZPS5_9CHLO|nr:Beta-glucan synthesis-associated protein SKN1 [Tetrabaena socialis]|eukprot:PNH02275.1 Beta-glucan synthesis-associated protein SKN1 [Tetrabaena socialis]
MLPQLPDQPLGGGVELNSIALKGATNAANQSVGDRLIPVDPQYININLAMSNNFAAISPQLPLPSSMEIDYVRIYQARSAINIGCDTAAFPSQVRAGQQRMGQRGAGSCAL